MPITHCYHFTLIYKIHFSTLPSSYYLETVINDDLRENESLQMK